MTDWKALCAELADKLAEYDSADPYHDSGALVARARAFLAIEPQGEGPSDEDLDELFIEIDGGGEIQSWLAYARAVLARWGRPAPVAADLDDVNYEWDLEDAEGEWQAGGLANSLDDVEREGRRYLQTFSQDGPHKLIIRKHCTEIINEITNGL